MFLGVTSEGWYNDGMDEKQALEFGKQYPYDASDEFWDGTNEHAIEPPEATNWTHQAARGVMAYLQYRPNIKRAFIADVDEVARVDIVNSLTSIIRKAFLESRGYKMSSVDARPPILPELDRNNPYRDKYEIIIEIFNCLHKDNWDGERAKFPEQDVIKALADYDVEVIDDKKVRYIYDPVRTIFRQHGFTVWYHDECFEIAKAVYAIPIG